MRIVLVLNYIAVGGGNRVAFSLAEEFLARGHSVEILVLRSLGAPLEDPQATPIPTTELRASSIAQAALRARSALRAGKPDVVLGIGSTANMVLGLSYLPRSLASGYLRPILIGSEHFHEPAFLNESQSHWRRRVLAAAGRRAYGHLDALVCVSEHVQQQVLSALGWLRCQVRVIRNPVRLSRADPRVVEGSRLIRRAAGTAFQLVGVGALADQKNWSFVLDGFAKASSRAPLKLKIAGSGPDLEFLREQCLRLAIAADVEFVGVISDMSDFLAEADLLVHGAKCEAWGLVMVEALSQGVPIVAARSTGACEISSATGQGVLVSPDDSDELARGILKVLNDPPRATDLTNSVQQFDASTVADSYLQFFCELHNSRNEPRPWISWA